MSWFGFGDSDRPDDIQHNFGFDLQTVDYQPNQGLLGTVGDLQSISEKQVGMGDEFSQAYRNMLDPNSAYYQRLFGNLRRDVGSSYARANTNMRQAMAQQGIGKGGMSSLLSAVSGNQMGEQLRKGYSGIQDVGLQRAGQFGQMATGAYGTASDTTGRAGNIQSAIDARKLQTDTSNVSAQNAYKQYLRDSSYNLKMANARRQDAYDADRARQRASFIRGVGNIGLGLATGNPMMAVGGLTGMVGGGGGAYATSQSTGLAMSNFPGQYDLSNMGGYGQNNFGLNTPIFNPSGNSGVTYP